MGLFSHSCVTALRGPCWDLHSVPELTPLSRATGSREQSVSCAVRRQRHHRPCCVLGCSSHLTGSDLRGTVSVSTQNPATSPSLLRGMGVSITTSVITTPLTRLTSALAVLSSSPRSCAVSGYGAPLLKTLLGSSLRSRGQVLPWPDMTHLLLTSNFFPCWPSLVSSSGSSLRRPSHSHVRLFPLEPSFSDIHGSVLQHLQSLRRYSGLLTDSSGGIQVPDI